LCRWKYKEREGKGAYENIPVTNSVCCRLERYGKMVPGTICVDKKNENKYAADKLEAQFSQLNKYGVMIELMKEYI
jgi:hypothetical protein